MRAAFAAQVFPRSERLSSLYAGYSLFTPRYRVYRDFDTYDLREDALLGPSASASASHAATWLGSEVELPGPGGPARAGPSIWATASSGCRRPGARACGAAA